MISNVSPEVVNRIENGNWISGYYLSSPTSVLLSVCSTLIFTWQIYVGRFWPHLAPKLFPLLLWNQ